MDKKVLLIVGIATILVFTLAGCFGGPPPKPEIKYEAVNDTIDPDSAWAESNWPDSNNPTVDTTIPLSVNSTQMVSEITVTITVEDSDAAHQESDDGSDPDDVTITLTNGDNSSQAASGSTPCTLTVKMNATGDDENAYMDGNWEVNLRATCNGGKPYTIIPRPGPSPLQYKDQGVQYSLTGEFTYLKVSSE
jgi:hypothetical protein